MLETIVGILGVIALGVFIYLQKKKEPPTNIGGYEDTRDNSDKNTNNRR
jgi:hypothetical protein